MRAHDYCRRNTGKIWYLIESGHRSAQISPCLLPAYPLISKMIITWNTYLIIVFELQPSVMFSSITDLSSGVHLLIGWLFAVLVRFNLVVVLNLRITVAIVVELLHFETVVIDYLIFLVALDFVALAVKIVALLVYLINIWRTYHLLVLFGGAGTRRHLQIALRVLCNLCLHDRMMMCGGWMTRGRLVGLRDSMRDLHGLDPCGNWRMARPLLVFLLDRLLHVLSLGTI